MASSRNEALGCGCVALLGFLVVVGMCRTTDPFNSNSPGDSKLTNELLPSSKPLSRPPRYSPAFLEKLARVARAESLIGRISTGRIARLPDSTVTFLVVTLLDVDTGKMGLVRKEYYKRQDRLRAGEKREAARARVSDIMAAASCNPSRDRVTRTVTRNPDWSDSDVAAIACRRVHIGMSADQAVAAWGRPTDINRTIGAYGTHEQWVYSDSDGMPRSFLYFEDGLLTTIQN